MCPPAASRSRRSVHATFVRARARVAAALLCGCALTSLAHAQAVAATTDEPALQPHASLVEAARALAARHTGRTAPADLDVRAPDERLRLPACGTPLAASVAPGTRSPAQLTVEVRCTAPAWRQYLSVRVRAAETVVVAARPIPRLATLQADDLQVVERELSTLGTGWFRTPEDAIGRIAQRPIGAGEVVAPTNARAPAIVKRGQEVTVIAGTGGFNVRTRGVALTDAGVAERIRVRNPASGRQVEGIVRSADLVEVAVQ